jgi:hypothetical protein
MINYFHVVFSNMDGAYIEPIAYGAMYTNIVMPWLGFWLYGDR